ncbi:MAG TPA: hypothetical protein VMU50_24000 [Polyangia bacterium]|nr:hypothetical protein [Polyangia bacterium]
MFIVNVIITLCLLVGGAVINRAVMKWTPRAGRSFLVPAGMAGLLVLCGLVMTVLVLVEARAFSRW